MVSFFGLFLSDYHYEYNLALHEAGNTLFRVYDRNLTPTDFFRKIMMITRSITVNILLGLHDAEGTRVFFLFFSIRASL